MSVKDRDRAEIEIWLSPEYPTKFDGETCVGVIVFARHTGGARIAMAADEWNWKRHDIGSPVPFTSRPNEAWGVGKAGCVGKARTVDEAMKLLYPDDTP